MRNSGLTPTPRKPAATFSRIRQKSAAIRHVIKLFVVKIDVYMYLSLRQAIKLVTGTPALARQEAANQRE
jgi:hypothetical protein